MKWFSNFSLVMRSSITTLREKIEDPERMLHQLIIDMEEELNSVRRTVAEAVADEIQMKKRAARERKTAEEWLERAKAALQKDDDRRANSAVEQQVAASERADRYETEHATQAKEVERLQTAVRELEDKIRQARQKKTLLTARMARANSSQKINAAMDRTARKSAFAQFKRFEDQVDREEAMSEAWDRMDGRDPEAEELEREFEKQERATAVENHLAELKAELGASK